MAFLAVFNLFQTILYCPLNISTETFDFLRPIFVFGEAPNLHLFKSIFKNSDNSYQNLNLHQLNSMLRVAIFSSLQEYHTSLS